MAPNQTLQNVEFSLQIEMCKLLGLDFTKDIKEAFELQSINKEVKEEKCDEAKAIKQEVNEHQPEIKEDFVEFEDQEIKNEIKNEILVNDWESWNAWSDEFWKKGWNAWHDESLKWEETPMQSKMQALKLKLESLPDIPDPEPFSDVKIKDSLAKIVPKKDLQYKIINGRIPCDHGCSKTFRNEYTYRKHIQVVHVGLKNKKECSTCGKKFQSSYHLRRHQESVHEGLRYHCNLCDRDFSDKRYLKHHIRDDHKLEVTSDLWSEVKNKSLNNTI